MSNPSLFENQEGGNTTPQNTPNPNDDLNTILSEIKNDKGEQKYKDVKTALDALRHSQEFIPSLRSELDNVKTELEQARAERERIKELEAAVLRLSQNDELPNSNQNVKSVSEEEIARIVQDTLSKTHRQNQESTNVSTVVNRMRDTFGSDADKVFYQKAQEAGLDREQINELSKKSPAAVFRILGVQEAVKNQPVGLPNSGVNSSGFSQATDSAVKANPNSIMLGATTSQVMDELVAAKQMQAELEKEGKSVYDFTDPKIYFKTFKNN